VTELLKSEREEESAGRLRNHIFPLTLSILLVVLFIYFIPDNYFNTYLRDAYLTRFQTDVGGQNAVTAIYLAYRVYDTLFEALMLVIAVVAVIHLSQFDDAPVKTDKRSATEKSGMALLLIRVAAPITILFGIYIIINGFITAGGGFQGGLAVAAFFICRHLIYDIYDMPIKKINIMEKVVFASLTILAALIIFQEMLVLVPYDFRPMLQVSYLVIMNGLLGLKVACGFLILFYRYIAIERN
jgi:multicomponent Na+:H+ antiporter subunit B